MYSLVALLLLGWTGDLDKRDFQVVGPTPVVASGPPLAKENFCLICGEPERPKQAPVVRRDPPRTKSLEPQPVPVQAAPVQAAPQVVQTLPQPVYTEVRVVPRTYAVPAQSYMTVPQSYGFGGFGGTPMSGGINCGTGG